MICSTGHSHLREDICSLLLSAQFPIGAEGERYAAKSWAGSPYWGRRCLFGWTHSYAGWDKRNWSVSTIWQEAVVVGESFKNVQTFGYDRS